MPRKSAKSSDQLAVTSDQVGKELQKPVTEEQKEAVVEAVMPEAPKEVKAVIATPAKGEVVPAKGEARPARQTRRVSPKKEVIEATDGKFVAMAQAPVANPDTVTKPVETNSEAQKSRVEIVKGVTAVSGTSAAPGQNTRAQYQQRPVIRQTQDYGPTNSASTQSYGLAKQQYQQRPQAQARVQSAPSYSEANAEAIVGVLDIANDGSGLVRPKFTPSFRDAYINNQQVRRLGLRAGDMIAGLMRAAREGEKYGLIVKIDKVNGLDVAAVQRRPNFNDLVPVYANKLAKLEFDQGILSTRIIDIFSPIGFGQRGMIVSPPKAGKTTLLKEIAAGVAANHPDVHLMAVLVGERPEEVTDMQRFIKGEVIASSFDQKPEEQTKAAEIAIERAKRLVEMGKDVFIVFDSITRLARAYNLAIPSSGRTLSGGFDPAALYPSKKFFGAARNIENGGSLTIIGTALIDTGSKMDELIFEEFKGTGNMELRLNRSLAERRIYPAFDVLKSGTRREDLLLGGDTLTKIGAVRRIFDEVQDKDEASIMVIEQMSKTKSNEEFLKKIGKQ